MNKNNQPHHSAHNILVFDSGVGGLSIVEHIRKSLPSTSITYLADNALFPYGVLIEQQLIDRVVKLVSKACQEFCADIVVIACNSASTLVLPLLRKNLAIPVVGVVPAVKPAAQLSNNKVIGLLATPGTIEREYTNNLINDFANECKIIRVGSAELVQLIEEKFRGIYPKEQAYNNILKPLREHIECDCLDTVVLACTHFPLALKELSLGAPEVKHWIDSGAAIARQIKRLLACLPAPITTSPTPKDIALFTQINGINETLRINLSLFGFDNVREWGNISSENHFF